MKAHPNLLSVDLEEWFVVDIFSDRFSMDEWSSLPSTVVRNSHRLLDLFERKGVKATWFTLGWCAEHFPQLMREIVDAGHEIGCHSYYHQRVNRMTPEQFRSDTERALNAVAEAVGFQPQGYRAPSWSVSPGMPWVFDVLSELGFKYDSSIFPVKHDLYGIPEGPRDAFKVACSGGGTLWEIPASTIRILGRNLPVGGGGYLRHSPYWYSRAMIRRLNAIGRPAVVYIHPWEFDPDPPRLDSLSPLQRFRTYSSTTVFLSKLSRLLDDFEFMAVEDYVLDRARVRIGFERETGD